MDWQKSSKCASGACVEVKHLEYIDVVMVRNSHKQHVVMGTPIDSWKDFLRGVKDGEFDVEVAKVH